MKKKLLAFLTLDQKNQARDSLVAESQKDGTFVKWSDHAVETKNCLYILKAVPVTFPIQEFAGFEEVEAPEILKELKKFVFELEQCIGEVEESEVEEVASENTGSPETNDEDDDDKEDEDEI